MAPRSRAGLSKGTLASIAADLGVSRTTVSNAYNRPDQLSAATRERIMAAAKARGYPGPDPTARSLRTKHAGSWGVVLTEHLSYAFEDMASVDFLAGIAESTHGTDFSLTLIPAGPDTLADATTNAATAAVNQAGVDGFIIYSVAANDPYLRAARARGLPVVVCDQPTDSGAPFVGIDDDAAIRPAVRAVLEAGHRRIGVLSIRLFQQRVDGAVAAADIPGADMHVQRGRVSGVLDECQRAGLDPAQIPVISRHINDADNARSAAREMLDTHPELTAIICTTDSMALAVLNEARERGISVPEHLSVTGFDGIAEARHAGLTTIIQPNKAKGAAAGRVLRGLIDEPDSTPVRRILGTSLYSGSTVAPPHN
ncbi:LacI family DNA-binding transcriptional regulator [Corynebacterium pseudodiphtheriticum]|uniref:LacI family DNA-binding transcriptional regulator n=1 Tax=Corynebacterium pseudodiphtheriticum TaxID=37637 RepID=UPI00254BD8B3|nr:LacI family DNA-binding transcriptional regulator [Corynebacterium pseudodiphtheriticum]MDK8546592.1 LacI family DNA-binding transcriptional regulator [Corynebacterium pseudodiphtheriticum]